MGETEVHRGSAQDLKRRPDVGETEKRKEASNYKCCEYFEAALDPNILRAYLGYCKARAWPFTVMVPIGGLEGECPKPPIKKKEAGKG
jgi:hypothetical protein